MPPDADKLRQRHTSTGLSSSSKPEDATTNSETITIGQRTLKNYEVIIDGNIYDLRGFDHPGGDSINIFGGNDVTVQYKMIHPFHSPKQYEKKLKLVGTIQNYKNEYKFDTPFEREVKEEVLKIVKRGHEYGTWGWHIRAIIYVSIFFYLQYLWVTGPTSYALAIIYGVSMAWIGLNVQHDANHGAASRKQWINDIYGLGADFIGGSKWLWMEKHWTHHTYTNHNEKDPDGFAAEPFILFNDYELGNPKRTPAHAYQVLWFFAVLSGYWISAVFNIPEVWELKDGGTIKVKSLNMENNDWIASRVKFALPLRILYLLTNVVAPFITSTPYHSVWTIIAHINIMGIAGSLALGCLFTLSHNFVTAERDPTKSHRQTNVPVCWYKAQVETSCTYGGHISGWLTGGLNFQVEHHLFPKMSSAWYPYIAPTVRRVCKKHGVKYVYYPWIWQNMISTLKYTHLVGNGTNHSGNPFKGDM